MTAVAPADRRSAAVAGSKNVFNHVAAVAMLGGDLDLVFRRVPENSDRAAIYRMLSAAGLSVTSVGETAWVRGAPQFPTLNRVAATMRVSVCHGIALACNIGHAGWHAGGGCAFTHRPLDVHLRVVQAAGGMVRTSGGRLWVMFPHGPRPFTASLHTRRGSTSVGATVTALLVAARAQGLSRLYTTSSEPEVDATISVLRTLGVEVDPAWNGAIAVNGIGEPLSGRVELNIPADAVEGGTYLLAGLLLGEEVTLDGITPADFAPGFRDMLQSAGVELDSGAPVGPVRTAARRGDVIRPVEVTTAPFPGFPTDLQPQTAAFLTQAAGCSVVRERVYDRRLSHVRQLARLGLQIGVHKGVQYIQGPQSVLGWREVEVTDIRCGAALLVAAAAAGGPVMINDPGGHLARGHSRLDQNLDGLGLAVTEEAA